jgi:hypothetical protein
MNQLLQSAASSLFPQCRIKVRIYRVFSYFYSFSYIKTMSSPLQTIVTQVHDTTNVLNKQYIVSFMDKFTKQLTNMFPGNVCNIYIGGRLLPCIIQHVTPGFVTVTIQVGPDVYIDQPILSSKFELLSAVTHNVDHITTVLSVGAHIGMRHQYVGEKYFGIVVHIEPIAQGVHVRFENGDFVKFKKESFSPTSKSNGDWCFVAPFTLMCDTYGTNPSSTTHVKMNDLTDITHMIDTDTNNGVGAVAADDAKNSDAKFFQENIFNATMVDAFEPIPMDQSAGFDSFIFNEDTIDEACDNADLMDELFP